MWARERERDRNEADLQKKSAPIQPNGRLRDCSACSSLVPAWLLYTSTGWFSTLEKGGSDDLSRMLLLSLLQLLVGLDCVLGAPAGREVYRMPQSALKGKQTLCLAGDTWGH